jgi:hypothetical protein
MTHEESERLSLLEEAHRDHRMRLGTLEASLKGLFGMVGKPEPLSGRSLADRVRALEVAQTQRVIDGPDVRRVERVLRAVSIALRESDDDD